MSNQLHPELVHSFRDLSDIYPQTLAGVVAGVGYTAMGLFNEGSLEWEGFTRPRLGGEQLNELVAHASMRHEAVGFTNHSRLGGILPTVFDLTRSSIITSAYEFFREEDGERLGAVAPSLPDEQQDAVRSILFEYGGSSSVFRADLMALFGATATALVADGGPARELGDGYRAVLLGQPSVHFPAIPEVAPAERKEALKASLSQQLQPILRVAMEPVRDRRNLGHHQTETFAHNITRP